MKLRHIIILACLFLGIFLVGAKAGYSETTETETGQHKSSVQQEDDWIIAHESNGPDGTQGVPMQRLTGTQVALAILTLLINSGLVCLTEDNDPRQNDEQK